MHQCLVLCLASLPKRRIEYEEKDKSLMRSLLSAEVRFILQQEYYYLLLHCCLQEAKPDNQHIVRLHEPVAKEVVVVVKQLILLSVLY